MKRINQLRRLQKSHYDDVFKRIVSRFTARCTQSYENVFELLGVGYHYFGRVVSNNMRYTLLRNIGFVLNHLSLLAFRRQTLK